MERAVSRVARVPGSAPPVARHFKRNEATAKNLTGEVPGHGVPMLRLTKQ